VAQLNADATRIGICGHSMGGHGALVLALRRPDLFRSVSALAPIAAPSHCPWGQKAFKGYLGDDRSAWAAYDASSLMEGKHAPFPHGILIDQGLGDKFLADQLLPERFEAACAKAGQPLALRRHERYDHGYYFISTFIEEHLRFHRANLG
jgi:S-formylglutathione hydrolase